MLEMKNPIVEMDGDEMTRIIWADIKERLLSPFLKLNTVYFDLGLPNREKTNDEVTVEAAKANLEHKVSVKCATITPNDARVKEYNLSKMYKSPNGTIRGILDGTVFREPIQTPSITPLIPSWKKPIIIARHAYGDVYKNVELKAQTGSKAYLKLVSDTNSHEELIHEFKGDGVIQGVHNTDASIESFARACFSYALDKKQDLWFSTKDTISKSYDGRFRDIFAALYDSEYKASFEKAGISYFYTLIDDAVARVMRSQGGFIWACKNYDGDVMSDMLATVFGSLAMMSSVLVSPKGAWEFEAAHGTVTRHYYRYRDGEKTSTNPVATIFAWSGALAKRGELDNDDKLINFAKNLEKATLDTIEQGKITGDLKSLTSIKDAVVLTTELFLEAIAQNLKASL